MKACYFPIFYSTQSVDQINIFKSQKKLCNNSVPQNPAHCLGNFVHNYAKVEFPHTEGRPTGLRHQEGERLENSDWDMGEPSETLFFPKEVCQESTEAT